MHHPHPPKKRTSRDAVVFIAIFMLVAWLTGSLGTCLAAIGKLTALYIGFKLALRVIKFVFKWLFKPTEPNRRLVPKDYGEIQVYNRQQLERERKEFRNQRPSKEDFGVPPQERLEITTWSYPSEWKNFDTRIFRKFCDSSGSQSYEPYMRFLKSINAIPARVPIKQSNLPECMASAVVKKAMWEHYKLNGTLDYRKDSCRVTIQEVERPIKSYDELQEFHQFCSDNY